MQKRAFFDLLILAVIFWSVWALRFYGVENIGLWTMVAGVGAGSVLMYLRNERPAGIGCRRPESLKFILTRAGELAFLIFIVTVAGFGIFTALGYPPQSGSAIQQQPDTPAYFILDIVFGVWVGAAIGEEVFFRGMLLRKFRQLFGGSKRALALAVIAQAVWFGSGHASQGLGGMIVTGLLAVTIAVYFVTRAKQNLAPLIVAHGFVNTLTLTVSYIAK